MPSHYKYRHMIVLLALFLVFAGNTGCAGTKPDAPPPIADTTQTLKQFLLQYEKSFDPTAYEIPMTILQPKPDSLSMGIPINIANTIPEDSLEFTSGYRVQILTTQEIDRANNLKDSLELILPAEWVYLIYHMPYYKVRVGNFYDMPSANKMKRIINEKGYKDAWVVPDRIVKNPPIKLPPVRMPVDTLFRH